jgi:hypothetical protein
MEKERDVDAKSHRMFTYVVLQERNGIWSLSLRVDRTRSIIVFIIIIVQTHHSSPSSLG